MTQVGTLSTWRAIVQVLTLHGPPVTRFVGYQHLFLEYFTLCMEQEIQDRTGQDRVNDCQRQPKQCILFADLKACNEGSNACRQCWCLLSAFWETCITGCL